jgi:chromosome segregation ATPase
MTAPDYTALCARLLSKTPNMVEGHAAMEEAAAAIREVEKERDNFANLYDEGLAWVTRCREEHDRAEAAEAKLKDMALDVLAASGQAQEAYEAQLAAEQRVATLEAKLAEVERERDAALKWAQEQHSDADRYAATVAMLTAQVEAMRGALRDIWGMCADHADQPDHYLVRGWVEVHARAALTTEYPND